jgi:hypothetical protein
MTDEEIHNVYIHMTGKAQGISEMGGDVDFAVLFARAIIKIEREKCAKQLDALGCDHCAEAIRARGKE